MDDTGSLEVRWVQSFTNKTIAFVDNKTVCYTCGSHICFLNLETKMQSVLQSPGRGTGALTASGNNRIFAFSEQKLSPSIFVYTYPECQLKNELKGTAQLDYTSLTLSDDGPYLGCCSSLPDFTITVWNWENAEPLCTQPQVGRDVISLVFNPLNWLQLCALGSTSLTVWNIEKSANFHIMKPSVIELPATDGSFVMPISHAFTNKMSSFGPEMPLSAISGLKGDKAESILTKLCTKARLTPTAICWTATSELYVGCEEGFLLLVDTESLSVSVIFNPTAPDAIPELRQTSFQGLTLNMVNGLVAVGKENVVHCLQIKGTQIDITQKWHLERPVTTVMYSPNYETLLLSSDTGQIYMLNATQSDEIVKVLDVLSGNFVAAVLSHTDKKNCVSVRDSGELQLWSPEGICLGSLSLQTEVTSLACCLVAQYAAVGTASGNVLFIDLNKEQQPRLVHQVHLYHTPVDQLVFDQEGHYLLTSSSDSHIYVLDAKPSKRFSVIGYTVLPGLILSISTQCIRDCGQVKALALCTKQEGKNQDGSLLTVLSLPVKDLADPDCVDRYGCLSTSILQVSRYEVPDPLNACVLGVGEVFAYCHKRKTLQRFQLPQDTDTSQLVVQLKPEQEVKGHPLGPASLALSPHHLWLASVGRDGLLRIRETASMEWYIELQCHSHRVGGVRAVSFSADSQTLLTTGCDDGSLVCANLRIKGEDAGKVNEATQYSRSMDYFLKNKFKTENRVLIDLPEWGRECPAATKNPEESEASVGAEMTVDVTEQDECYNSQLSAPPSHPTWLESRREAVIKEDNENYSDIKEILRREFQESRDTIQEMINENETLPENERLELWEFNLDVEEQKRLDAMVQEEVTRVRNEIEMEILEKKYLCDVLKREYWDSMKVKGRAVRAFHSEHEVKNYPMKERTGREEEELRMVENMRKLENAACAQSSLKTNPNTTVVKEEKHAEEGNEAESAGVTGSLSDQLGCSNPYLYNQFSLHTTEQRINQIILLQDVIYRVKTAFNADFDAAYRLKLQELNRVRERNRQITGIMLDLDINEKLWEPSLTNSEQPERMFTVDDSEIKAEKYLTPEQKEEEEKKKLEEQRCLAAKGENLRDRALDSMMNGVLEVKKEDILKMEIPPPEFVLTKPDIQWSEEEKKEYKIYENKTKSLAVEKDKYKKSLETEMRKLQKTNEEATKKFDETLIKLFEKKIKSEMAIYQEEFKITYLVYSVLVEEEMRNQELELKRKLEKTVAHKDEIGQEVKRLDEELELFQEIYDSAVAEDKVFDKEFRKEFYDVPNNLINQLYKLFKRRPRIQKIRAQTDNSNLFKEKHLCASLAPDAFGEMLKAMEELDAPENMPEGLNPSIWERFCLARRAKAESEQKVKVKALTLAEMQAFLQKRRDEEKDAQLEIKNLSEELESLHKEKNDFLTNIMVQVLLKQGQVEVSTTDLTADYSDSVLLHRSLVEDLNRNIRTLGEEKIASMDKCKNARKGIIQLEWEHKMRRMQIEDLNNKAKDIQMLQLSEVQRDYLNMTDRDTRDSKELSTLEKTIAFKEKTHELNVQKRQKKIKQLNKQAAKITEKNATLEQHLPDLQVDVAMRTHIYEATVSEEGPADKGEKRYQEIVQRRKLEDLAKAQAEDLALLMREVERLRRRNFPSLDQLKHK
ncbi:cilia- and flagella-associated protein 43 isoform X1 [Larimichthys crocea]|uniref:cilia- and flagella-associated protein 43 isoform X1 n=1 Tax=Larimichthys crocea TaxID=215358 RepID=UPI000F5FAA77|nr:cilia- and flagella-associated protein 43 isoform X1 [Larimichthys crocea]